ncbi:hypothetical protein CAL7716_074640 [Calothrix sp. PCC 7716]|nr:hypothetical protein CAL7716_074640 [Calothrix sp. PCC 7716]
MSTHHTKVVSTTPGRTRLRVSNKRRNQEEMERISTSLQAPRFINSVEYNHETGSILVHHDTHEHALEAIKDIMKNLGIVFADVTGASEIVQKNGEKEGSDLPSAIYNLNQEIRQLTNGLVDLRFLLPLGLFALGLMQLQVYGLQLELMPWYLLIYFAFETFVKLNFNQQVI